MIVIDRHCPDDLVMRGHRKELSQIERRALAVHLDQCPACRAASAVATLFDAIPDVQPGDEALIAAVATRTLQPHRSPVARRWLPVAAAVIVVVASGAAAATWVALRRNQQQESPKAEIVSLPGRERLGRTQPGAKDTGIAVAPGIEAPEAALVSPLAVARPEFRPRRQPQPTAAPPPKKDDAASLFAAANAVRRAGELGQAMGLYQSLRRQFPESGQALLASLSVADILLDLGDPAGAIGAYDSYLNRNPPGALTEEALFGRARCLARLGRPVEERQTWEELVRHYPRSAYRPSADRRLQVLGH